MTRIENTLETLNTHEHLVWLNGEDLLHWSANRQPINKSVLLHSGWWAFIWLGFVLSADQPISERRRASASSCRFRFSLPARGWVSPPARRLHPTCPNKCVSGSSRCSGGPPCDTPAGKRHFSHWQMSSCCPHDVCYSACLRTTKLQCLFQSVVQVKMRPESLCFIVMMGGTVIWNDTIKMG